MNEAWLLRRGPADHWESILLDRETIQIGRDPASDVRFDSRGVHAHVGIRHARLFQKDGAFWIEELQARNGTFVNGQRILEPRQLDPGTYIRLGASGPDLYFHRGERPAAPAVPPPDAGVYRWVADRSSFAGIRLIPSGEQPSRAMGPFRKRDVVLGRHPDCDVALEDGHGMVSRVHARISLTGRYYTLHDLDSLNGTWLRDPHDQKFHVVDSAILRDGDEIALGDPEAGPAPIFRCELGIAPTGDSGGADEAATRLDLPADRLAAGGLFEVAREVPLDGDKLVLGRAPGCTIVFPEAGISREHLELVREGDIWRFRDLGSLNGVYQNGVKVRSGTLEDRDFLLVGGRRMRFRPGRLELLESSRETVIEASRISHVVESRGSTEGRALLTDITFGLHGSEFVGLLGPSGAGKTTLLHALNGASAPTAGQVRLLGIDIHRDPARGRQLIGHVPQDDVLHPDLTVRETLDFAVRIRLPGELGPDERRMRVDRVLEQVELSERADLPVRLLSGGQRKRVSVGIELVTEPRILFLDEPTTGLDPKLEQNLMTLFRNIANGGRTLLMTTHVLQNAHLFDRLLVLHEGRLAFLGRPEDAVRYFGIEGLEQLYGSIQRKDPGHWQERFVQERAALGSPPPAESSAPVPIESGSGDRDGWRFAALQAQALIERYRLGTVRDWKNLTWAAVVAPVLLAIGIHLAIEPKVNVLLIVPLSVFWLIVAYSSKELVKERPIYLREKLVGLDRLAYLASKIPLLFLLMLVQSALIYGVVSTLQGYQDGRVGVAIALILTGLAGMTCGLALSAHVRSQETAQNLVPMVVILQILFSGVYGETRGLIAAISVNMPVYWGFDLVKQHSGAKPKGEIDVLVKQLLKEVDSDLSSTEEMKQAFDDVGKRSEDYFSPNRWGRPDRDRFALLLLSIVYLLLAYWGLVRTETWNR